MTAFFMVIVLLVSNPLALLVSGIGAIRNSTYCKRYALLIACTLAVLAFSYYPTGHSDLVRYYEQLDRINQMSLLQAINYMSDGLFVKNVIFWIVSKLELPSLLQTVSVGVVYGVSFYITADYASKKGKNRYVWLVLLIQFLLLNYVSIANNVRNVVAFALICLAVYRDLEGENRNAVTILLYILPCFIHKAGFVLILLRIALYFTKRRIIIPALATIFIPQVLVFAFRERAVIARFGTAGRIISDAIITAYRATTSTSAWANTVMTSRYHLTDRYVSMFLCACFVVVIIVMTMQNKQTITVMYFGLLCILTLACNVFRTPAYWRFYTAAICIGGPLIIELISEKPFKRINPKVFQGLLLLYASMVFVLHLYGARQDISVINMVADSLLNPLGVILGKVLLAVAS